MVFIRTPARLFSVTVGQAVVYGGPSIVITASEYRKLEFPSLAASGCWRNPYYASFVTDAPAGWQVLWHGELGDGSGCSAGVWCVMTALLG